MAKPAVYMIAGPNGAGKTTLALKTLPDFFSIYEFVNADEIARGLNPLKPEGQALTAGRLMLNRIDDLITAGTSFSFETTGASRGFSERIRRAKQAGYRFGLFFVWLPNAQAAKERVKLRVSQGGHNIPEPTIERRYMRSLANLINIYLPLADKAEIYNGSLATASRQRVIAEKNGETFNVYQPALWYNLEQIAKKAAGNASE